MVDIEDELYARLCAVLEQSFPGLSMSGESANAPESFPHLSFEEVDNSMNLRHMDNSGAERFSDLAYQIDVYSNKSVGKKAECKAILNVADGFMYQHNFIRYAKTPVPMNDSTVLRVTAVYKAVADGRAIYRT